MGGGVVRGVGVGGIKEFLFFKKKKKFGWKCINLGQRQGKVVGRERSKFKTSEATFRGQEWDKLSRPYGRDFKEDSMENDGWSRWVLGPCGAK